MRRALIVAAAMTASPAMSQTAPVLGARAANAIVAGCVAQSTAKNQSHAIAVVDSGGHLIAALRMDGNGSGIFDFVAAGGSRLFHSRRIGLTPDLQPVRILGGAKLVGRAGAWEIGALEMQTAREGDTPAENFGVFRIRRPVFNENSTAGLMLTTYAGAGRTNVALGIESDGFAAACGLEPLAERPATLEAVRS